MDARILLVEDDPSIREITAIGLRSAWFDVDAAVDGQAPASTGSEPSRYDLVLLDAMLPRLDGLEVCRAIRRDPRPSPWSCSPRAADTIDVVVGLEAGADDYVRKPFEVPELVARVRAAIRRRPVARPATPRRRASRWARSASTSPAGPWSRDGREIALTRTEFDLPVELARNPGRVLTRDVLLDRIWGYDYLGDLRLVDVGDPAAPGQGRDDPAAPELIQTVRGAGY